MLRVHIDEFAKNHLCDADWVSRVKEDGGFVNLLSPGEQGTTSGYPATVVRHYSNGMYDVRVPGGTKCISSNDFDSLEEVHAAAIAPAP